MSGEIPRQILFLAVPSILVLLQNIALWGKLPQMVSLVAGACFGSVPQGTIAVGTVPWAAHPEEAKDSHTTYSWCEFYLQTERTLFELTGKINFGREHHAHCGCKHKLGHPQMQGMFLLLWFLLTCGPNDKENNFKVNKEKSLYKIYCLFFKVITWTWLLSHSHRQVRWEQWKVVSLHF